MINLKKYSTKQDISTNRDILENRESSDSDTKTVTQDIAEPRFISSHAVIVVLIIVVVLVIIAAATVIYYVRRRTNNASGVQQSTAPVRQICDAISLPPPSPPKYEDAIRHITLKHGDKTIGTAV